MFQKVLSDLIYTLLCLDILQTNWTCILKLRIKNIQDKSDRFEIRRSNEKFWNKVCLVLEYLYSKICEENNSLFLMKRDYKRLKFRYYILYNRFAVISKAKGYLVKNSGI